MLTLQPTTTPANLLSTGALSGVGNGSTGSAEPGAAPSAFARMLQDSRPAASVPPRPGEPHTDEPDPAPKAPAEATAHAGSADAPPPQRPAAPAREGHRGSDDNKRASSSAARPARAAKASAGEGDAAARTRSASTARTDDPGTASNPALADWLASLRLPDPAQPVAVPGSTAAADPNLGAAPASAADTTASHCNTTAADGAALGGAAIAAGQAAAASVAGGAVPAAPEKASGEAGRERAPDLAARAADHDAGSAAGAAPGAATARHGAGDGQTAGGGAGSDRNNAAPAWVPVASTAAAPAGALPAALAAFSVQGSATGSRGSAEPVAVNLPAPVDSPEFPRALGVELSVLARSGIERAELHLSPAEMGPVSVQIAIDGTQARIDFGADVAGTRQAIEAGLPELASALRDAGLTLTGGGVSQHSRGRGDAPATGHGGQARNDPADTGEAAAAPVRRVVRAGGVDMYV